MYDYYLGSLENLAQREKEYLVSVKRLLPKWLNGIPDSEFVAMWGILDTLAQRATASNRKLVLVETGVGASTLALAYCALKYDGMAYTWDPNAEKASQIRTACTETFCQLFKKPIGNHWTLVSADSASPHLGLPVLSDLTDHVDFFFHDGDHVWEVIQKELVAVHPLLADGSVVAIDDAQYDFIRFNEFIINVQRRKLGLPEMMFEGNRGQPFYRELQDFLAARWTKIESLADAYRQAYKDDLFFAYYDADMSVRKTFGSDRFAAQEHRFEAWCVSGRCK